MEIKLFQTIQKNLATMGFIPNQQQIRNLKSTSVQIIWVTSSSINSVFLCVYIACVASSMEEYTDSIFSLTVIVGIEIAFISIIHKNDQLFNTIELCVMEMQNSK